MSRSSQLSTVWMWRNWIWPAISFLQCRKILKGQCEISAPLASPNCFLLVFCFYLSSLTWAYFMSYCPGFFQLLSKEAPIHVAPRGGGHLLEAGCHFAQGGLCLLAFIHLPLSGLDLHHWLPPAIHYCSCGEWPKLWRIFKSYCWSQYQNWSGLFWTKIF